MPNHEIRFRIRGVIFERAEFIRYRLNLNSMSDEQFYRAIADLKSKHNYGAQLPHLFEHRRRARFFTETYDKTTRLELINANLDCSSSIAQAEHILAGKINLLGRDLKIPFSGGWHVDPLENEAWPRLFYAHLKKSQRIHGWDIKYIWEVNRHQYFIVLGKAYWLTGDERYAEKVVSAINSWIHENPYNMGVNWTSSLELAVRTISWLWAYFFCQGSRHLTRGFEKQLFKSIYQQATYIENHLSYYSSPYNHLIGEAAALHLIGSLFPMFNSGKRWERLGWSILTDRVGDQFHEDGMSVEQASFYHHFTLGFYLQSIFIRRINNKTVPVKVLARIEKALEFSLHLTKPDGTLPMIGDIDNARALYFNPSHRWDFGGFLTLGAILFNRPEFKDQSAGLREELLWFATEDDLNLFLNIEPAEPTSTSAAFYHSGYFISRDSWNKDSNYLCFDCGEMAAGLSEGAVPSAAHGHADALSFELVVQGKSFIVDGGFYTYFGDLAWHKYFRHEEAHNTVLVGNYRQAEYCGRLTWQKVKPPNLLQWEATENYDAVAGRVIYSDAACHLRQMISIKRHLWLLRDFVKTKRSKETVKSFLHFAPEVDLRVNQETRELVASIGPVGLLIKYLGNAVVQVEKGGDDPSSGWVAHGYGIKFPAWRAQFAWKTSNSMSSSAMLMIPFRVGRDSIMVHCKRCDGDSPNSIIDFSINEKQYSVNLDHHDHTHIAADKNEFHVPFPYLN